MGQKPPGPICQKLIDRERRVDGTLQVNAPFHLAIDQQDRIWVTNSGAKTVTRFPASDPGKAEHIEIGYAPRAIAIDSHGNVWIANNWNRPDEGFKKVPDEALSTRFGGNGAVVFFGLAKPVRTPLIGPVQAQ